MKTLNFIHNNETAVKIKFNKKFNFYEALTAAIDPKNNKKIQNYGNDFNCNAATIEECRIKIINILKD